MEKNEYERLSTWVKDAGSYLAEKLPSLDFFQLRYAEVPKEGLFVFQLYFIDEGSSSFISSVVRPYLSGMLERLSEYRGDTHDLELATPFRNGFSPGAARIHIYAWKIKKEATRLEIASRFPLRYKALTAEDSYWSESLYCPLRENWDLLDVLPRYLRPPSRSAGTTLEGL
jgi:hypothetical protein